jgi:hypothetical protein
MCCTVPFITLSLSCQAHYKPQKPTPQPAQAGWGEEEAKKKSHEY